MNETKTDASDGVATTEPVQEDDTYRALVVDSGPIIRLTGLTSLRDRAKQYFTVPAVFQEIRDAKARQHLENLPFDLISREASPEGIQAVIEFARQTGDYNSLSSVDLQVLGLLYDLEREGCGGDMSHVRKIPKRRLGVGRIESLAKEAPKQTANSVTQENEEKKESEPQLNGEAFFKTDPVEAVVETENKLQEEASPKAPKSWAMLVNPSAASRAQAEAADSPPEPRVADQALNVRFGSMDISGNQVQHHHDEIHGQFSDPEEDEFADLVEEDESDEEGYGASDAEISDEECDVYILDPEEVEERKKAQEAKVQVNELELDFPSLAASLQVPYDGSDDEEKPSLSANPLTKEEAEVKREAALLPVTKSGKMYNSFRKYGELVKPDPVSRLSARTNEAPAKNEEDVVRADIVSPDAPNQGHSRISGGMAMSGQGTEVEDDGEGWITCSKDIRKMKSDGHLDPTSNPHHSSKGAVEKPAGPPLEKRAACATTDFAMQNVILQMNLELLSVDGIKLRRLKSWVTRCGSCFTVYSESESTGPSNAKRLFCSRCGSDFMQRVAASVDGKTGRLRLHLSKKHKNSLRGTKFSLPKAGSGDRFQGDLLLREDQLLVGAWNQKVKQSSGGKARKVAQSMFGSDLASNVGCNASVVKSSDIHVGFGRRNPNASKHGRERRGKKKKSSDKACGLRRYPVGM